jgi:hypothetical protein
MVLGLAPLSRARAPGRSSFGRGLAAVVPTADRLEVVRLVVVAGLDVVDVGCQFSAPLAVVGVDRVVEVFRDGPMALTTALPVQADKDPRALVDPVTFDKLALHFAAVQEVTKTYARRAVGQMLLMLKAHADSQHDPDFGRLLPDGRSYRVVPTEPVDAAWHASLQHTEPYAAASSRSREASCTTCRS